MSLPMEDSAGSLVWLPPLNCAKAVEKKAPPMKNAKKAKIFHEQ
jgi:hypothetical protein